MKRGVYSILSDISNNKYDFIMDGTLSFGAVLNKCENGLMCSKHFLTAPLHICLKFKDGFNASEMSILLDKINC